MKRIIKIYLAVLAILLLAFLCSCAKDGATGPRGEQGERGVAGPQGERGEDGVGVAGVAVSDGELIITYTDGREESLGKISELVVADDLQYYPLDDGTYAAEVGNSIYLSEIVIPAEHKGRPVSTIVDGGFSNCKNLVSITIPESVTVIGKEAFRGCNKLENINIPNGIEKIGNDAFLGCNYLKYSSDGAGKYLGSRENPYLVMAGVIETEECSVTVNENTRILYNRAFHNSRLTEIIIGENITYIGTSAFSGCENLESLTLPFWESGKDKGYLGYIFGATSFSENGKKVPANLKNLTILRAERIEANAFNSCQSLVCVTLPEGLKSIGEKAFYNCTGLTGFNIPSSVTEIGDYAFFNCLRITEVKIPKGVTAISENSFRSCIRLETVELPDSITEIGYAAFYGCEALKRIYIPIGVQRIENDAFRGCAALSIYCEAPKRPRGWNIDWNYSDCVVAWGWNS